MDEDTAVLERETTAAVQRNLISLQNQKKVLITPIVSNVSYLHALLTQKKPDEIKKISDIIVQIEEKIETQYKKIIQARNEGINISRTLNKVLYNELVVCKEIKTKLNDMPRLIEKLDELDSKMLITMQELRAL